MTPTPTQLIFMLSKAYGQDNCQDMLPVNGWTWPSSTWLQRRLEQIRKEQADEAH